ncbi:Peptidyl-prolyl cis-trans isomerase cyp18 [Rosistilla oblonga]|uniref:Peptidyl-prolyl cis-trans isomerase n=3 Tax=Rosistilla TaxID=2795779 RepID=A0A518ILZ3_9BACT|nr:peptidylprolyl isomerase [Rosistilla ulvae]QDS85870.1 Peptidyl-prolyl cis-trans isomerase cyp18 [Rosistilla ulvae]QDV10219.1 Peptidyl-prolyl cis-trans isomerase cyp18 [Rosistilla oblonga]QDV54118.1 Peptidyl-prolyl cis-trans isomerase cyp18 [Rosistilla oblonga]
MRNFAAMLAVTLLATATLSAANPVVVDMKTSMGPIQIEMYPDKAPETVKNFVNYANKGFYDGTIFHRVIDGFMIQGGGFTPNMQEKETGAMIQNESANGLKNEKYTIAMARTPNPHSATSQFFINTGTDNGFLDRANARDGFGYCVFGKVTKGTEIVDAIGKVATGNVGPHGDVPRTPVIIEKVTIAQ